MYTYIHILSTYVYTYIPVKRHVYMYIYVTNKIIYIHIYIPVKRQRIRVARLPRTDCVQTPGVSVCVCV